MQYLPAQTMMSLRYVIHTMMMSLGKHRYFLLWTNAKLKEFWPIEICVADLRVKKPLTLFPTQLKS